MRIKGWGKFQHYKKRNPPWIRFYRDILDDPDFFKMTGDDFKVLAMCWLVASEDKEKLGYLPDIKTLAFRLRKEEEDLKSSVSRLSRWIIQDDIKPLAPGEQDATAEAETDHKKAAAWTVRLKDLKKLAAGSRDHLLCDKYGQECGLTGASYEQLKSWASTEIAKMEREQ